MSSETGLSGLSSSYPDPVVIANPGTGEIFEANFIATEFFGYTSEEFRSMNILDLHPRDGRERYQALFENHFDEEPAIISQFEDGSPVYAVTADGHQIPVEINAWALESEDHDGDQPLFQGVFRDVSKRVAYERRLTEQRDNLKVLNEILRHDIRNDLQIVTGYTDILAEHVDEDGMEYLERVQTSATNAIELTNSARDMADAMLSKDENLRPVNLTRALERSIDEIRPEYPNAVVTVGRSVPRTSIVANDMLDSVFRNLLVNAVQHHDGESARVVVSVAETGETVRVRIADEGPGVPDSRKEAIFGRGEKGIESGGTGIGLYLVDTLVERYGGDVWVEDNEPEGTIFVVELRQADDE